MRQNLFLIVVLFFSVNYLSSQSFSWIMDTEKGYEIPVGTGNCEELETGEFYAEMKEAYNDYHPDQLFLKEISEISKSYDDLHATIVFGAWCGDSREHLPHFYKVLHESNFLDMDRITLVACDRDKKAGDTDIGNLDIELVPTFIIYDGDRELGRIIETPVKTLEEDIYNILSLKD